MKELFKNNRQQLSKGIIPDYGEWGMINRATIKELSFREGITPIAFRTYTLLCSYANDKGLCFPNQSTLAEELNTTRNSIINAYQALRDCGFIKTKPKGNSPKSVLTVQVYSVHEKIDKVIAGISDDSTDNHFPDSEVDTPNIPSDQNHIKMVVDSIDIITSVCNDINTSSCENLDLNSIDNITLIDNIKDNSNIPIKKITPPAIPSLHSGITPPEGESLVPEKLPPTSIDSISQLNSDQFDPSLYSQLLSRFNDDDVIRVCWLYSYIIEMNIKYFNYPESIRLDWVLTTEAFNILHAFVSKYIQRDRDFLLTIMEADSILNVSKNKGYDYLNINMFSLNVY